METENHDEAVEYFSIILSLDPEDRLDILIKRSKVRISMGMWEEAMNDADEVILSFETLRQSS